MRHNYFNLRDENFQCVITGTVGEVRALSLTALVGPLYGQSGRKEGRIRGGPPPQRPPWLGFATRLDPCFTGTLARDLYSHINDRPIAGLVCGNSSHSTIFVIPVTLDSLTYTPAMHLTHTLVR